MVICILMNAFSHGIMIYFTSLFAFVLFDAKISNFEDEIRIRPSSCRRLNKKPPRFRVQNLVLYIVVGLTGELLGHWCIEYFAKVCANCKTFPQVTRMSSFLKRKILSVQTAKWKNNVVVLRASFFILIPLCVLAAHCKCPQSQNSN